MDYKSFIRQLTSEKIIAKSTDELNKLAATKFIFIARDAIKRKGKFSVALAGGSTPKSLYRLLTTEKFHALVDWTKVFFFFGDERNVLPTDEESNFKMANESLLKPLNILTENIFRWQTELVNPQEIAEDYEEKIKEFFNLSENEFPRFDLILLGMGDDGHTASLFPRTEALNETKKIAVANLVEKLDTIRLTLTFPTINNAANVIFLIGGRKKAEILREVLTGEIEPEKFPSQNVKPRNGNLFYLLDKHAARNLE
ncbi:MAG TPA: 6-phosphogluconolactonase [Pyrinomonadaceae bacterium]|nr:6-phosphogluconolactonase [Pyrinomonadaceae bacterium]